MVLKYYNLSNFVVKVAVAALFLQLLRHPQAPNLHPVANHLLLHHHLQVVKHHQLLQALVVNRLQLLQAQAVSLPQLYHQLAAVSHLQLSQVPVLNFFYCSIIFKFSIFFTTPSSSSQSSFLLKALLADIVSTVSSSSSQPSSPQPSSSQSSSATTSSSSQFLQVPHRQVHNLYC